MNVLFKKIYNKIKRAPQFFFKKIKSIQETFIKFILSALTDKYWLIDYLPSKYNDDLLIVMGVPKMRVCCVFLWLIKPAVLLFAYALLDFAIIFICELLMFC